MKRIIEPELLDELPPDNPLAIGSRRDLRRINAWMRNHVLMAGTLQKYLDGRVPGQIAELGAGDGHFLLQVARRLPSFQSPANVNVSLIDRQEIVAPRTLKDLASLGWRPEAVIMDVFGWLRLGNPADVVVTNLFLHHFQEKDLKEMFHAIASCARLFIAVEPRRAPLPLFCSRLLRAIGCNRVTRHDATVSVRAGFSSNELTGLWPNDPNWHLIEQPAGPFSRLFIAQKIQRMA